MAARFCGPCGVNWPSIAAKFGYCPICDGETEWSSKLSSDFDEAEAFEYARVERVRLEAGRGKPSPAHANRVERYLALGFSEVDAQVLALATRVHVDSVGRKWVRPVNHLDVARALAQGCSPALVLEIFS